MSAIWFRGPLPQRTARVQWVDAGKGIAITLVVLFHTANWLAVVPLDTTVWREFNEFVATLRMPLFFMLSGLFAAKWATAPLSELWNRKLSLFVWVFLLWEVIGLGAFLLAHIAEGTPLGLVGQVKATLLSPIFPRFELWFLWALTLAFLAIRVLRHVPVWLQLVVFGAISAIVLTDGIEFFVPEWSGALRYFFFFLLGMHLRAPIIALAERSGWLLRMVIIVVWAGYSSTTLIWDLGGYLGVQFINALLGAMAGVALSRLLVSLPGLTHLGKRTLPIYVAHTPFVILIMTVLAVAGAGPLLAPVVGVVVPLTAAAAIALSLGLERLSARSSKLAWLFAAPRFFRRANPRHETAALEG